MLSVLDAFLQCCFCVLPFVAGLTFLMVLFSKEMRPALGSGLWGAAICWGVGLALFGKELGSEDGWGWASLGAMLKLTVAACVGFLLGLGMAAAHTIRYRKFAWIFLLAGILLAVALPLHFQIARAINRGRRTGATEPTGNNQTAAAILCTEPALVALFSDRPFVS